MNQNLLERIQDEFPSLDNYYVELSIIGINNEYYEFYEGLVSNLKQEDLSKVFLLSLIFYIIFILLTYQKVVKELGKFYFFRIISVDQQKNQLIKRKDFCWLTDPLPPRISAIYSDKLEISWEPISFSTSMKIKFFENIEYIIEVAEGKILDINDDAEKLNQSINMRNNYDGSLSNSQLKYIHGIENVEFLKVFQRNNQYSTEILDLDPSRYYYLRLGISYNGITRFGPIITTATAADAPSPPSKPRMYFTSVKDSEYHTSKPSLLLRWSESISNGSPVMKYQVQVKQITHTGDIIDGDVKKILSSVDKNDLKTPNTNERSVNYPSTIKSTLNSGVTPRKKYLKPLSSSTNPNSKPKDISNIATSNKLTPNTFVVNKHNSNANKSVVEAFPLTKEGSLTNTVRRSLWKTVYANIDNRCYIQAPDSSISEWHIRVRSKNQIGWSGFSELLIINYRTNPSLFVPMQVTYKDNENVDIIDMNDNKEDNNVHSAPDVGNTVKSDSFNNNDYHIKQGLKSDGLTTNLNNLKLNLDQINQITNNKQISTGPLSAPAVLNTQEVIVDERIKQLYEDIDNHMVTTGGSKVNDNESTVLP